MLRNLQRGKPSIYWRAKYSSSSMVASKPQKPGLNIRPYGAQDSVPLRSPSAIEHPTQMAINSALSCPRHSP